MLKKNYKFILGLICGLIISISGVYAAESIIESINVSYDNSNSGGKYTTVQESIDELYEKSGLLKEKWIEKDLNGADPILEVEGSTKKLIPIIINSDGVVKYANLNTEWYNYKEKRWANAVILVDKKKDAYKTGDIIDENDIESYFVWIPRYSYKIWDMGNYPNIIEAATLINDSYQTSVRQAMNKARIIDIKFGNVKTNPKMSESQAQLNEYYTHPAFTLGDKDLNGIWVGKFETGYNQDGNNGNSFTIDSNWTTNGAQKTEENSNRIIVKPNVYSWRSNTTKNFFLSSYNYARGLESHMMKNIEWGAVAYLSHSIYGLGNEIRINNNSDYKTGYSAGLNTNQSIVPGDSAKTSELDKTQPYNSLTGYMASATGNITGIYDMSGGTYERMAACMDGIVGNSGFDKETLTNEMNAGYIDRYSKDSTATSFDKRILGDATGELGPFYGYIEQNGSGYRHNSWYSEGSFIVEASRSWFSRGSFASDGVVAGQFYARCDDGDAYSSSGFRLVLAPK